MLKEAKILGYVLDAERQSWAVRQIRSTKYGFDLLFGSPETGYRGGHQGLIATRSLIQFWKANQLSHKLYDLPAGRSTLKRIRRRFGLKYLDDLTAFWDDRTQDLLTLHPRDFSKRYQIKQTTVRDRRLRLVGSTARPLDWWRTPERIAILQSNLTLKKVGTLLSISTSHAFRLRKRARNLPAAPGA